MNVEGAFPASPGIFLLPPLSGAGVVSGSGQKQQILNITKSTRPSGPTAFVSLKLCRRLSGKWRTSAIGSRPWEEEIKTGLGTNPPLHLPTEEEKVRGFPGTS